MVLFQRKKVLADLIHYKYKILDVNPFSSVHTDCVASLKYDFNYLNWQLARLDVNPTIWSASSASSMHCLE